MKKLIALSLGAALLLTYSPIATAATDVNPYGTSTVDPAAPNEILFTVSKGKKKISYSLEKLGTMKSATISIYEPFLKKRQSFTVIPMKTFFNAVGIKGNDKVRTIAINDYIYSNAASKFISADAFIAIKRNGVDIPYNQGGPLRIVFADKSKFAKTLDAWNWSLNAISVK